MKARVTVTLKTGVLDPQGLAIQGSLRALGFAGVESVRQGKVFDIALAQGGDAAAVEAGLTQMCEKLLANTVIENYAIEIVENAANTPLVEEGEGQSAAEADEDEVPAVPEADGAAAEKADPEPESAARNN